MAQRRMFSKSIISSARFLKMPVTARLLYYDLGMAADDDGFVEAFTVLRTTGASEDDLHLLSERGFITILDEELVTRINDWEINNQIRKDRYVPSVYHYRLGQLGDDNRKNNCGLPHGNRMATQYSIGKEREDKDSPEEDNSAMQNSQESFDLFWSVYPKKVGKKEARRAFCKIRNVDINTIVQAVNRLCLSEQWTRENGKFIPYPATWLNRGGWEDELESSKSGESRLQEAKEYTYTCSDCIEYPPGSGEYIGIDEWEALNING